ncbi:hypothetical protein Ddye_026981 [Dipteronia dyeriana]|uniref:Leucine-rich repeat-containing N-terminal plant-type domain-containing protein n=1 Tax=Dipteronia dyeriana TaxID=168575 RepID=A0AAD9TNV4_9ROSI|nr:hypothetical protein Ddye_026981 [Dipteronia dyeriana]
MSAVAIVLLELLAIATINISFCSGSSYVGCIKSEGEALSKFKQDLKDPSNRLASWTGDGDCCTWNGVVCNNYTGHVLELRLENPYLRPRLEGLSSLKYLDLSTVNLSNASDWLLVINRLPSLVVLKLRGCLDHNFRLLPIANTSLLATLDLSFNNFDNSILSWVFSLTHLVSFTASSNNFQGPTPEGFKNLTSLRHLLLDENKFNSSIPNWLYTFSHLESLDLGKNSLQGMISDSLVNMTSITYFDVSFNKLEWTIPRPLGRFCNLKSIFLAGVKLSQEISEVLDIFSTCNPEGLQQLVMSDCQLFGHIPSYLGEFSSLVKLDLSFNKLNGTLSETHFANLTNLLTFIVSGNSLILNVSPTWHPAFQLLRLGLGSCHLGPRYPSWLHSQKQLSHLDLSGTGITDTIPKTLWDSLSKFRVLNLSHNQFYGEFPGLTEVDNLISFDLSFNNLSGSISHFICNGTSEFMLLQILNLGDNFFSGEIPDCWMNWNFLTVLNLGNNKFSGNLPISMGTLTSLQSLHLRENNFSGTIPVSLKNCTSLLALDIGENEFVGNVPTWVGESFSKMLILNVHSNNFHGLLPPELCHLASLQILDVAYNNLSGTIPKCFSNFSAMVKMNYSSGNYIQCNTFFVHTDSGRNYLESASLVIKGREVQYSSILNLVRSIDLSNNNFSGEIPTEVTNLEALQTLNLSHNFFSGKIPESIGAMGSLESVDLSSNQFSGKIPKSISSLTLLSHLNLSDNNLIGKIPSSTQLQSFDTSSFTGNELCGPPLLKNCTEIVPTPGSETGNEDEVDWLFYVSITLGFIVGFWSVIGSLLVNKRWRYMYCHFLDLLGDKLWNVVRKCC